jgi:hypothetical protein
MSKLSLVLLTAVLAVGSINAQTRYSGDERGGAWVKGHWSRSGHHRHWVAGHWTTSEQAREEYKQVEPQFGSEWASGKFVDSHWSWQDGQLVYVLKHFVTVAPEEASFSAAALNSRLTAADREDRVTERGLGEM